jgi:transcription factor WhiB
MTITDARWRDKAACRAADPDLFYPDTPAQADQARQICRTCPVRVQCLTAAVRDREDFGIRGGLTPQERRPLSEGILDTRLAQVFQGADETGLRLLARTVTANRRRASAIPPDPDAAMHRAVLLAELDAYEAAHRGERLSVGRRWPVLSAVRPQRQPSPRPLALRQAHSEAERLRNAGRPVPWALKELEREYWRVIKQVKRGGTSYAA